MIYICTTEAQERGSDLYGVQNSRRDGVGLVSVLSIHGFRGTTYSYLGLNFGENIFRQNWRKERGKEILH